jgi:hypothetical protein
MSYGFQIRDISGERVFDNTRAGRVLHSRSVIGQTLALPSWRTTPITFPDLTIPAGRVIQPFFTRPLFAQPNQIFSMTVAYPSPTTARVTYVSNDFANGYSIVYFFLT